MTNLFQELRLGVRTWVRRPGFAAVIVATLAIGIGANVAVYTVIDGRVTATVPVPGTGKPGRDPNAPAAPRHFSHRELRPRALCAP